MKGIRNKRNIYGELLAVINSGQHVALATIVQSSGSTPQVAGSAAIFSKNGLLEGTVGGGYIEYQIQQKAKEAIQSKQSGYFRFELKDDIDEPNSVICGGGMHILLDADPGKNQAVYKELLNDYNSRNTGILVTLAYSEKSGNLNPERFWVTKRNMSEVKDKLPTNVFEVTDEMLKKNNRNDFREIIIHTSPGAEDNYAFLETVAPLPQLLIAGAGHVGKALSHIGKLLDFEVTVWDDRDEFANAEHLPDADKVICGNLEETLGKTEVTRDTFIVILTRGHQQDAEVLKRFINSEAGYIGMMGSRKKVAQVREQSLKEGWATEDLWKKIVAPIGLEIHSKTIREIAVSIAAQLVQVRYNLSHQNG